MSKLELSDTMTLDMHKRLLEVVDTNRKAALAIFLVTIMESESLEELDEITDILEKQRKVMKKWPSPQPR